MKSIKNNNTKGFAGLLLVFLILVLLAIAAGFYAIKTGLVSLDQVTNRIVEKAVVEPKLEQPLTQDSNKVYVVDFAYQVKSITKESIVLSSEKGDVTLTNNPLTITVYKGPTKESPKMELSQLKVGDTVNAEFVVGKSTSLFVSTI